MPALIIKMLTLVAILAMPFGMGAASASPGHHAPIAAEAGHCGEQGREPAKKTPDHLAGCAAGCAMFIADSAAAIDRLAVPSQMMGQRPAKRWTSLPAETATPPPKLT